MVAAGAPVVVVLLTTDVDVVEEAIEVTVTIDASSGSVVDAPDSPAEVSEVGCVAVVTTSAVSLT